MKQFQVPQFITVEDKVFGPLTIKQFLYILPGALLIIGAYAIFQPFLFYPVAVITGSLSISLAFLKISDVPFPIILKNAAFYLIHPRLYVWKRGVPMTKEHSHEAPTPETTVKVVPKISQSKLSDLAWNLDVKEEIKE